jgi:hypothetical protein
LKEIRAVRPKNSLMPEYLMTPEELSKLFNSLTDLQDRFIFGILYESGCLVSEITSMNLNSVSFNTYGARIQVKGKTGQRAIPIVWYANMLRQLLEDHPNKNRPDSFLWYYRDYFGNTLPINSNILRTRLKRACKKIGIAKKVYPHILRHTRLTELSKGLPEQTLKLLAGWTADSKMAKMYIHLSNKDVEDSLLSKVYGIKVNEDDGKKKLKVCPKCSEVNPYFAKLCQRCKTPLDEKELMHEIMSDDKNKKVEQWSKAFMAFLKVVEKKHPDIWEDMEEVVSSIPGFP